MVRTIKLISIAFIFSGLISCTKNDTPTSDPNITFVATLNSASEVPPNASTATGSSTLVYNDDTNTFTISTNYSGLTGPATGAHIHKGAIGVAGGVIFSWHFRRQIAKEFLCRQCFNRIVYKIDASSRACMEWGSPPFK